MAGKYWKLERHLMALGATRDFVTLHVQEIESILGFALPSSASRHGAWWSNTPSHSQSSAWMNAGFLVDGFNLGERVRFRHVGIPERTTPHIAEANHGAMPDGLSFLLPPASSMSNPKHSSPHEGTLALISCTKSKRSVPSAARDLYTSAWFRKAMGYVERLGLPWYILSAKHGLVHPDDVLEPYEHTLKKIPAQARRAWADQVAQQILAITPKVRQCIFLAGHDYREHLLSQLWKAGVKTEVPMEGLARGHQMNWLDRH
jgi:hypothetical protein